MTQDIWVLDACYPVGFQPGYAAYLSYCDARCAFQPNPGGFAVKFIISSNGACKTVILDVEPGNLTPDQAVDWTVASRAAGFEVTNYVADDSLSDFFNGYKLSNLRAAYIARGVAQPHYWVCLPGKSDFVGVADDVIALQTGLSIKLDGQNEVDISLVRSTGWPGVVSALEPPIVSKEQDMFVFRNDDDGSEWVVGEFTVTHIPDQGTAGVYIAATELQHGTGTQLSELQNQAARAVAGLQAALGTAGAIKGTFTIQGSGTVG